MYRPETAIEVPWTRRRFWANARRSVPVNVWLLGVTSLLTDVSAEMVASVLPAYLMLGLGLSPLAYGAVEGLHVGATVATRWLGGVAADWWGRYKGVALLGYGLSAVCRAGLLVVGSAPAGIAGVIAADRLGKGLRTAPRDALISLSATAGGLAQAFGVHRALDAAGALMGPLVAFWVLRAIPGAYDVVFVTSCAVAIVGVAVLAAFVREVPGAVAPTSRPSLVAALALVRHPAAGRIALAAGTLGLVTASDGLLYVALQTSVGFPAHWLPLLSVGTAATFLLLAIPVGMLADRWGRTRVFVHGHLALLLVHAALLVPITGAWMPIAVAVLLGVYYAATDGVLMALASTVVPADQRGSGLALAATASSLGRMGAALGFGVLWSTWSREAAVVAFALALACSLAWVRPLLSAAAPDGAPS